MPWDGTKLFAADIAPDGALAAARLVAGETPEAIVQPEWSADGALYFCSDRTGWWNLYAWRDGKIEALAPVEAEIGGPHWVFRQRYYDFLGDGRIIAAIVSKGDPDRRRDRRWTGHAARHRPSARLSRAASAMDWRLSQPRQPRRLRSASRRASTVIRQASFAARPPPCCLRTRSPLVKPISFATPDGLAHAFWYPPKNRDYEGPKDELPPLVVLSHGGPTSMTTNSFSLSIQWWTSRGFGVVDVNYGGSTGFGRAYRERLTGQWGVVDVEDCAAAAKHLVEHGLADPARLVIRGGSAGGFTTLAALTSLSLFKAGASHYGVGDLMLLATDTHKFESRYLDKLIGPLPQAKTLYAERSPINHIGKLACPVIFFQGEDDKTVPPNQAQTMVEAMNARGLPVAFYLFPGEGHGFRKAETMRRVLELELDFYGKVFGFTAPGLSERVVIANMK